MDVKLKKFRAFAKKFILGWCLLVLLLTLLSTSASLFKKGPSLLIAQEEYFPEIVSETPVETTYNPEVIGESPVRSDYDPEIVGETPVQTTYAPEVVGETPVMVNDLPVDQEIPPPVPQPQYQPQVQEIPQQSQPVTVVRSYPECAGGPGMVQDVDAMSDGTYRQYNQHFQAGACGDTSNNQPATQTQAIQTQPVQESAPTVIRTYSECAGGTGRVHQVDAMSDGTYRTYNEHIQSGACGDDGRDRDGATVVRTYSECANTGPGRVHDIEQLSNGGYRTFNEHFQSGVCGDPGRSVSVATPMPTPTPYITAFDTRCDGTTRVFFRRFSDGRREDTGQREERSSFCGYQASPIPVTNNVTAQGGTSNVFVQTSNPAATTQFPALSISCLASPSSVRIGESMTWRVMTTGGSGSFNYRWSGEGVDGQTGSTIFTSYNTAGNRTIQVAVRDMVTNNEVNTACSTQIQGSSTFPTPTITPTPTPTSTTIVTNPQIAQCPSGTIEKSRSVNQLICEAQNRINPTVVQSGIAQQCPAGTVEKSRSGSQLLCEAQITTVVASASPATIQTTVVNAVQAVQCPSGTIEKSRSSTEIICERQVASATNTNNIVVNPSAPETKESVTVLSQAPTPSVKELPKTGLPLAAVAMASLTPVGLRIRKLLKMQNREESANSIWMLKNLRSDLV